jgi:ABC-type multidrug transport system fused ATPase/permease subunit
LQAFYDKVLVMDAGRIAEFAHPLEVSLGEVFLIFI